MENLPNEIVLHILGYLKLGDLIQCARVSKRLQTMCKDKSLSYESNMLRIKANWNRMKDLTVNDRKSIIDYLIARPEVREVNITWIYYTKAPYLARPPPCVRWEVVRNQTMPKIVMYYD